MIDLVIPTIGRSSLPTLIASLARSRGPRPQRILLVDDRRNPTTPLQVGHHDQDLLARIEILPGSARGPAAARNLGWRASHATWIAFLDDDVVTGERWLEDLERDVAACALDVAGTTGCLDVPLPAHRKPTDWERNVAALATAQWITADCAYRRSDLLAAGGFDERFPRAFREDVDLALRITACGKRIITGGRRVSHPVRHAPWWISVRLQAGNADDVLMKALHGRTWHRRANATAGVFRAHIATVAAAGAALVGALARKRRLARTAATVWALLTGRFWWLRFAPGPRTAGEASALAATSVAIPFVAAYHHLRARFALRRLLDDTARAPRPVAAAVLLDRDGTLIVDVPFNRDPARVQAMPGARAALDRLRSAGIPTALISNQSGIARGRLTHRDVERINASVERLVGPLGPVFICAHDANAGCACRKPAPGLIEEAARELGVHPQDCVVIGDIGADVEAAHAAGARAILVPTSATLRREIDAAPRTSPTLELAVGAVLDGRV